MAPFISAPRQLKDEKALTKVPLSQRVFDITRDFKFFSKENFKAVHMKSATSADRPAKLAKSAIFWMKRIFFLKKYENDPISSKIMSAGSGRCIKSWPETYSASPKATSTYSECSNIYFTSLFMKKYVLHKFFFQKFAQKVTKNSYFFSSCKSFGKNIKKIFLCTHISAIGGKIKL